MCSRGRGDVQGEEHRERGQGGGAYPCATVSLTLHAVNVLGRIFEPLTHHTDLGCPPSSQLL